jgi:hypothetical protein
LLELIKQRVAIEKLKHRNIDFLNAQLMGDEINLTEVMAHRPCSRLQLPLLFLEIPANSRVNVSQDDSKMHLRLSSDQSFVLRDENALFQSMGLMKTSDDELGRIFSPEITDYLKQQILVEPPSAPSCAIKDKTSSPKSKRLRPPELTQMYEADELKSLETL